MYVWFWSNPKATESNITLILWYLDYFTDYIYFNRKSVTVSGYISEVSLPTLLSTPTHLKPQSNWLQSYQIHVVESKYKVAANGNTPAKYLSKWWFVYIPSLVNWNLNTLFSLRVYFSSKDQSQGTLDYSWASGSTLKKTTWVQPLTEREPQDQYRQKSIVSITLTLCAEMYWCATF